MSGPYTGRGGGGTLTPDSFTVGSTTHTVEILAHQTNSFLRLMFLTDTGVTKADLEGLELRITVAGVAKTLAVSSATNLSSGGTDYGIYWDRSIHGYQVDDWPNKTITIQLRTANNPPTGRPTISGTAQVGQTLTAATSGIMDSDGLTSPTYTHQWIRVNGTDADISGATSGTYTLVAADQGKTIKVKVSFTDDASNAETLTSAATAVVAAAANNPATGAPTISGTAQVGQTLTAATSGIMDSDGLTSPTYTYQWIRVNGTDADISGATSGTYTLVAADQGKTIKVKVSFTDDASNAETLTSAATAAVAAPEPGYAQSAGNVTYVSNIGQGSDDDDSSSMGRAQTFTTGSRTGGYTLISIDIVSEDAQGDSFTANITTVDEGTGFPVDQAHHPHGPVQLHRRHDHLHRPRLHRPRAQHDLWRVRY